jgi:hypothetical protein
MITKLSSGYDIVGHDVTLLNETSNMEKRRSRVKPVMFNVVGQSQGKVILTDPEGKKLRVSRFKVNPVHDLKIRF